MSRNYSYTLPVPETGSRRLAAGWLALGIGALVAAGAFAILLVMARTPYIKDALPWGNFFHTAMVVHVDLSVLMWFLPCAGIIWSFNSSDRHLGWGWAALGLAAAGAVTVVISPFAGTGMPLMNNYFPVIESSVFFVGMGLFGLGFTVLVIRSLVFSSPLGSWNEGAAGQRFGVYAAAVAAAVALSALIWPYFAIPDFVHGRQYYEILFWGSGHVLQFTHTLLMVVVWLWLTSASGIRLSLPPRATRVIFALGVALIFLTPWIYLSQDILSLDSTKWFTRLMWAGGGLAALPLGIVVITSLVFGEAPPMDKRIFRTVLVYSLVMFGVGGILGFMIQGSNTLITAHYHAANGAVTIAFMGLCYLLLPQLGFRKPNLRLAGLQAHAFGVGQLLHVLGLAWAGGYGMQRKIAGSGQTLDNIQQTAGMALMGIGGLIAVIGGILFLVVVIRSMWPSPRGGA